MQAISINSMCIGLAGFFLGGILSWVALGNVESSEPEPSTASFAELTLSVKELGAQVKLLGDAKIHAPTVSSPPVRRVSEPALISPEFLLRLDTLDASLAKLLESYTEFANSPLRTSRTPPPLKDINRPVDVVALEGLGLNEDIDNDLQHMNWSYQKVLNVYGKPSESRPSPGGVGHKWYYWLPNGEEVIFWFVDGQVARALAMD